MVSEGEEGCKLFAAEDTTVHLPPAKKKKKIKNKEKPTISNF